MPCARTSEHRRPPKFTYTINTKEENIFMILESINSLVVAQEPLVRSLPVTANTKI